MKLRSYLLPLMAGSAMFGCATASDAADGTLGRFGYWELEYLTLSDGAPVCELSQRLLRQNGGSANGWISITTLVDGGALIVVESDDWQTVERREYGGIVVGVDSVAFNGAARGVPPHAVSINIAPGDGAAFWAAFRGGRQLAIGFPNDSVRVALVGSSAGFAAMQECWVASSGRDPFAAPAAPTTDSAARDPFSM